MRRAVLAAIAVVVLVGAGLWWFLRDGEGPGKTAERYTAAWQRGDFAAMRELVADPPADFAQRHTQLRDDLGVAGWRFAVASTGKADGDKAGGSYSAELDLGGGHRWSYEGALPFVRKDGKWRVAWSPQVMQPELKEGLRVRAARTWADRGSILAADGQSIDHATSGSVQQLVGTVGKASAEDAKKLGPPYRKGDPAGLDGLQRQYEARLSGKPSLAVQVVNAQGGMVKTLQRFGGGKGTPLRTTLDLKVQRAAGESLAGARKPASLVAVRPSTGEILAVANKPGGYNRALLGRYPPGSTFKVITAAAAVAGGLAPDSKVGCPPTTNVGGRTFKNHKSEDLGTVPFRRAFAESCNTTFARLAVDKLGDRRLTQVARMFGFDTPIIAGLPAVRGAFPQNKDATAVASAAFGQGDVLASPLNMAGVAAAAANGTWHSPRLVSAADAAQALDAGGKRPEAPHKVEAGVTRALRNLMPAVVSEGTARNVDFPRGTAGKTGTAEFGSGKEPPTHAWFIGYRGDVAFAVVVEGGGAGAEAAAPIAARFLRGL